MINIFVYGVDQFLVGDLSKEITPLLSKLYEVEEDDINFIAPNNMVFHKGVEQTSWKGLIKVEAPEELERVQKQASELLLHCLDEVCINMEVIFAYYCRHDRFVKYNEKYPKYLTEENTVNIDTEYDENMTEGDRDDEIFTGDIFAEADKHHHEH